MYQAIAILIAMVIGGTGCDLLPTRNIKKSALPNGATLISKIERNNALVGITCFMRFGPLHENAENTGITQLALNVARKATQKLNSKELAEKLEVLGASVSTDVGADYASLSLSVPRVNFEEAHKLFLEILTSPRFAEDEVVLERTRQLAAIRARRDDPFDHAYERLQKDLYGSHPYAFTGAGTLSSVKNLQKKDMVNWFAAMTTPKSFVIAAVGNISHGKLSRAYNEAFEKDRDVQTAAATRAQFLKPGSSIIKKQTSSAWIVHGYPFDTVDHKNYAAMKALGSILGGGMSSRLFNALREEKGLTYSTGAFFPTRALGSHLGIYASTPKEHAERVSHALAWLIRKWRKEEFPQEEVNMAKEKVIGAHLRAHQSTQSRSWYLGWYEVLGWGSSFDQEYLKFVRAVTPADIQSLLEKLPENPHEVIVAPNI